ncbi:MAG: hypothetical protein WCC48_01430 [Anaeromyxobacteraceae bacterium]
MEDKTNATMQLSLTPAALEELWKWLWRLYESYERDLHYAYDNDDRYRCKIAAGAAGNNLSLLHDPFAPNKGACSVDCEHIRAGLSPAQTAAVLTKIDRQIANAELKAAGTRVPEDGSTESRALQSLRASILKAATDS